MPPAPFSRVLSDSHVTVAVFVAVGEYQKAARDRDAEREAERVRAHDVAADRQTHKQQLAERGTIIATLRAQVGAIACRCPLPAATLPHCRLPIAAWPLSASVSVPRARVRKQSLASTAISNTCFQSVDCAVLSPFVRHRTLSRGQLAAVEAALFSTEDMVVDLKRR